MPVSKTQRTLQSSTSNGAGSTTTGSGVDLSTALGIAITARITNGGTGPTLPCGVTIEVSSDGGTTWRPWASGTAGTANNAVYDFSFDIPPAVMRARSVFTGNTGQAVTVEAFGHELTSL